MPISVYGVFQEREGRVDQPDHHRAEVHPAWSFFYMKSILSIEDAKNA